MMTGIMEKMNRGNKGVFEIARRTILFLLPILIYLPTWGGKIAVPPGGAGYSDLLITHYPYLLFLKTSILIEHQVPLWSNMIHSGAPFAANPLANLFYLPGWAAMLFPLPAGLSLMLAAHAIFGSWGMYRFLRQQNVEEVSSILGGICFGLMPKLAAHFGAGHVSLLYAVSWTPWLMWSGGRDRKGWVTGAIAAMLFLADPRWAVYAGLLWITFEIAYRRWLSWNRAFFYIRLSVSAILLSAPLLLSMLQYVPKATRSKLSPGDILTGRLPGANLAGVFIPGNGGNTEWYWYAGGAVLAIFMHSLLSKKVRKENRYWMGWITVSIILALGIGGDQAGWLSEIPVVGLLRVPARSLFLTGFCFSVFTARAMREIITGSENKKSQRKIDFCVIIFGVLLTAGILLITECQNWMFAWGLVILTICGILILIVHERILGWEPGWILVFFVAIDFLGAGLNAYELQEEYRREPPINLQIIIKDEDLFRTYSPSYSLEQHLAAEYQLELADGVDPMQIASYADFMSKASGVGKIGYSVTIPPFQTGNPAEDNRYAVPNLDLLGLLNVKYIVSVYQLDLEELSPLILEGDPKVYLNEKVKPRAWLEIKEDDEWNQQSENRIESISIKPNSIRIEAIGPGRLVISEVDYPGWKVLVDGVEDQLDPAYTILRSVNLQEGKHQVSFVFRPNSLYVGLAMGFIGLAILITSTQRKGIEKISD